MKSEPVSSGLPKFTEIKIGEALWSYCRDGLQTSVYDEDGDRCFGMHAKRATIETVTDAIHIYKQGVSAGKEVGRDSMQREIRRSLGLIS